jgi:DNA-binding transcriptional LysR family regulator
MGVSARACAVTIRTWYWKRFVWGRASPWNAAAWCTTPSSGELVQLSDVSAPYAYPYWLVWPPRERSEGKQREFSQWLSGEVERYLGQLKAPT